MVAAHGQRPEALALQAATVAMALGAAGPANAANPALGSLADAGALGLTLGATGAIAGLAYVLINTDPDKRRVLPPSRCARRPRPPPRLAPAGCAAARRPPTQHVGPRAVAPQPPRDGRADGRR